MVIYLETVDRGHIINLVEIDKMMQWSVLQRRASDSTEAVFIRAKDTSI